MERFLLFDSGCSLCTELANSIERETDGWLKARSLREPEVKTLLDRARPGWRWEPTLLEVEGEHVSVFTGLAMRMRLLTRLGLKQTWRIAKLVRSVDVLLLGVDLGRRQFLKLIGGSTLALIMNVIPGLKTEAESSVKELSSSEATRYITAVVSSVDYQSFKRKLAQDYKGILQIQEERSSALEFQKYICVVVPVSGGAGSSAYVAWFVKNSEHIVEAGFSLYTLDPEGNIVAWVVGNGKTIADAIVKPTGEIVKGVVYDEKGQQRILKPGSLPDQHQNVGALAISNPMCCITNCLAYYAVPIYIISLLSLSCNIACRIPGLGGLALCVSCISFYAGIYAGIALRCVYDCYSCKQYGGCTAC